ncbi:beta-1,3-galactosyltransferase 1-like [Panulirus ornatus]|uniref:beta-1,3-galactosyltransferase 1-like n=1 Tax=Panulirus ornatus TaxID=150431 RepID=UPI003A85D77A
MTLNFQERNKGQNISSSNDKFPFRYLINEPKFCNSNENLFIINFVATAPWEVMARSHIRRLWGNKKWLNMTGFKTIFLLGEARDLQQMENVREESNKYHDMIQISFLDTYDNLTLKIMSGLHWINTFCSTPAWVLKSDSDVLVNIFALSSFLHKYDEINHQRRNNFLCKKNGPVKPCRKFCEKKWQVSLKEYPFYLYPVYCLGPGYIIPRRLVATLYQAANKTHPFRMEDVYYTGLIPAELGWGDVRENIAHHFPWRPKAWQKSFITTDLMIYELEKHIGRGASTLVWNNILNQRGLLSNGGNRTNIAA